MRYIIPEGTDILRYDGTCSSDYFRTTKKVIYEPNDLIRVIQENDGAPAAYEFSLPKEAHPWISIWVIAKAVTVKKAVMAKKDKICEFDEAWVGKCKSKKPCSIHNDKKCWKCDEPATKNCSITGSLVCGVPECDKHAHAYMHFRTTIK